METEYKQFLIVAIARQHLDSSYLNPCASISWVENEQLKLHGLSGPADRFTDEAEAEGYMITIAKKWIDTANRIAPRRGLSSEEQLAEIHHGHRSPTHSSKTP
jgi:hypothetical protein